MKIAGDAITTDAWREHANKFVARRDQRDITGNTISKYAHQIRPAIDTGIKEPDLGIDKPFGAVTIPGKGSAEKPERLPWTPTN